MSLKLLKQSIDILENDGKTPLNKTKKQMGNRMKNQLKARKQFTVGTSNAYKPNIEDIKTELSADKGKAERNLRKLLAYSQNVVKTADAEKIMNHMFKEKSKKVRPQKAQESIFTEEDFLAFEREYFQS